METVPLTELVPALSALDGAVRAAAPERPSPGRLVRVEVPAPPVCPLEWLAAQSGVTRYYWRDRAGLFENAGLGEADVASPADGPETPSKLFAHLRRHLPEGPGEGRYYGGFRFQPGNGRPTQWQGFLGYRFVAPLLELHRKRGRTMLAATLRADDRGGLRDAADAARAALAKVGLMEPERPAPPRVLSREDLPDRAHWEKMVARALAAFDRGKLEKVVLARETRFTTDRELDPVAVLQRLARSTRHSFCFCFHPARDRAFLGASPERLFRRTGRLLESEAVAGTCPRDPDPMADALLAEALLASEKDRREQGLVTAAVRAVLDRLCDAVESDPEPGLLTLLHCRHLRTRISGTLREDADDGALLEAFHPTPAVGGTPRGRALDWIAREEPFDRGLYAAPVGWVARDGLEFCVAIRSGLVRGDTLAVYNGAGVVPGSVPAEEWAEIETKMRNFLRVLRHDGQEHGA